MALSVATGAFNISTAAAGNTVAVSSLGFQPKVLKLWWSGRTESVNAGGSASINRGIGWAVSPSSFVAASTRETDGVGTSVAHRGVRDDACVLEISTTANVGWADLQSFDVDGFTLEILSQFSINLRVSYTAYGGSDITDAEIGVTASPLATGQQSYTNAGFQPNITFLLMVDSTAFPAFGAFQRYGYGAATSSTDQYVLMGRVQDNSGSGSAQSHCRKGECIGAISSATTVSERAQFVSHNANGFTLDWIEVAEERGLFWLSIKGGNWKLGDLLTQTDTTTPITESSFGFAPTGLLFLSHGMAESTADTIQTNFRWSMGAAAGAVRTAQSAGSRNGNTNMFTQTYLRTDVVYVNGNVTTDAVDGLMNVQSFDSDGFTAIMTDADPSQEFVWYVASGSAAAATKSRPVFNRSTRFYRRSL